jgi:hypothetical protein
MTEHSSGGAFATAKALWKRAPFWRLSLMTAALMSLVFLLLPPEPSLVGTRTATPVGDPATYTPRRAPSGTSVGPGQVPGASPPAGAAAPASPSGESRKPTAAAAKATGARDVPAAQPKTATLSMVRANPGMADNESGLDTALLGRLYRGSVVIDGFNVPLPSGDWANLANSTIALPAAAGHAHFLGKIRNKRLVAAVRIFAVRSKDAPGEGFDEVKSCTEVNPGRTFVAIDDEMQPHAHQACWTIRSIYATPWAQWADRTVKLSTIDRAAAGDMTAKGVTYPQDFVSLTFTRTEQWGLLEVMYLFSPESEGISSNAVLSVSEADWTPANIGRYPEKVAYVEKLKAWGIDFWPKFKAAFAAAQQP